MKARTHLVALGAVVLACGSSVDLGTPYGPDAAGGAGGTSGATTTTGSGGSSTAATGSGSTSAAATGSGTATTGSGSTGSATTSGGGSDPTTGAGSSTATTGGGGGSGGSCTRNGTTYPVGASFPAGDSCNTCTCQSPNNVICTRCACISTDAGTPRCGSGGGGAGGTGGGSDASVSICSLPFDSGPCDAAVPVFAYVNGACVARIYGGCQGNANRFNSIEECMATCDGQPDPRGCPVGRIRRNICLACGPAGGCSKQADVCAETCTDGGPCTSRGLICYQGVCQAAFCE